MDTLGSIMARRRYALAFGICLLIIAPVLSVTSNIVVPSVPDINPGAEPLDIVLVGLIAALISLNAAVLIHNLDARAEGGKTGVVGTIAAFFTTACPVCQPIWLVWLGLGSATAFLAEYGRYVSLASIGLLGISLHYSLKSASGTCEVKTNGKND